MAYQDNELLAVALTGSISLSFLVCIFVGLSWWGGEEGYVVLSFNRYGERLAETILFPIWTIGGAWAVCRLAFGTSKSRQWPGLE